MSTKMFITLLILLLIILLVFAIHAFSHGDPVFGITYSICALVMLALLCIVILSIKES